MVKGLALSETSQILVIKNYKGPKFSSGEVRRLELILPSNTRSNFLYHTSTFASARPPPALSHLLLLTPPHTIPAVLVQTARKTTQNSKENIEEKTFFFLYILTHKRRYMWS